MSVRVRSNPIITALKTKMSNKEEPSFKRRDLDTLPAQVSELTQDHYDRLKHALSYYEDVSQLQRETLLEVRQQLWQAQREYHGLFLTNPAPIAVINDDGTILKCNSAMLQMFHLDEDHDKMPNIKTLFGHEDDLQTIYTNARKSPATDWRLRRVDGTTFIGEVQVLSMRASDQQEHLLMFRDITHHKYTQDRLELFEAVVTQAKDAVHVMRCVGEDRIPTETIYINEAFEQMFGYTSADLKTQDIERLWGADTASQKLQEHYVQLHKSGYSRYHETFYHKAGTPLWVDVSTCIIGNHERGCYWLSIMSDASQQKDLIDRMMRIDRILAMGTLAAGIGHEVSNPLTYAKANVEYVRAELEASQYKANKLSALKARDAERGEQSQEMILALDDAHQGLERASSILEELRMFAYRREPTEEVVSLNEVIESACSMVNHELNHRAKLSKTLEHELYVRGDRGKLEQIIINLLLNAIQALPEHSSAHNHIQVRLSVQGHEGLLEVIDNGVGFSEEIKEMIFEPFFTTKTPGEGTGLGLAIVHNIVNVHGGSIEVSSEPGQTCFKIKLPLDHSVGSALEDEVSEVEEEVEVKPSILIIDDEPQILRVLERLLQREYQVTAREMAKEGLALLRQGVHFDIVLCDVMMPEMNGVAFYKAVHDELPQLLKRLVFISGGAFTPETTHFLEMLEAPLIRKPFQLQELLETLVLVRKRVDLELASPRPR